MKTWFKRKFPEEYLDDIARQGAEEFAFIYTEEIRRAYAHIEKTEALLVRADEITKMQETWFEDLEKFKGGE